MRQIVGVATAVLVTGLLLTSCAAPSPDPALVSTVGDLISSGRSVELGLELDESDKILPGTLTTLLDDMADEMAESIKTLELAATSDAVDAEYRDDALTAARHALDAVHLAQQGHHAAATTELDAPLEELSRLEDAG